MGEERSTSSPAILSYIILYYDTVVLLSGLELSDVWNVLCGSRYIIVNDDKYPTLNSQPDSIVYHHQPVHKIDGIDASYVGDH